MFEFLDKVATECVGEELKEDVVSCLDSITEDNIQVSMEDDGLIHTYIHIYIYIYYYYQHVLFVLLLPVT